MIIRIDKKNDKVFTPDLTAFGGVRQRSRLHAIITKEVSGERLLRAGWATRLGSDDGINSSNALEHEAKAKMEL